MRPTWRRKCCEVLRITRCCPTRGVLASFCSLLSLDSCLSTTQTCHACSTYNSRLSTVYFLHLSDLIMRRLRCIVATWLLLTKLRAADYVAVTDIRPSPDIYHYRWTEERLDRCCYKSYKPDTEPGVHKLLANIKISVFTARCTLVQSAVLRSHVVRLSVCLSVCNVGGSGPHRLEILETNCTNN